MESMISLGIERLEIDWRKNHFSEDHSALFLPGDVCAVPYHVEDGEIQIKEGFSRRLASVAKRLDLLGYSPARLEERYDKMNEEIPAHYPKLPLTFAQFRDIFLQLDLDRAFATVEAGDYDLGEFASEVIFRDPEIRKLLPRGVRVGRDEGTLFENFDPYVTLRILALNPANAERLVQWRHLDRTETRLGERHQTASHLTSTDRILIVTEGSSDSFIIKKAIAALYPEIADFFDFVDMEENYPFTGTGNLHRFCQGLARIGISNQVLVVFDNDAAGIEKFAEARRLERPPNLHICRLPDHPDFRAVRTVGPNGVATADINGAAVAIECFLDWSDGEDGHLVRWTSFNEKTGRYQGEIERKDQLVRAFKKANLAGGRYNTKRLKFLIESLLNEWVQLRHQPAAANGLGSAH